MMGRPTIYTTEIADEICERLAAGEALAEICRDLEMPGETTVYRWLGERLEFRERYACAREWQAEHYADEIIGIADSVRHSESQALVQAAKLAIDTRKWAAAKAAPKKYGDKLGIENKTTLTTADPLTALMERIATAGRKVHDPQI